MHENANCDGAGDGAGPCAPGDVRVLPYPGGNIHLCRRCYAREMHWRRERNRLLSAEAAFDLPKWETLQILA